MGGRNKVWAVRDRKYRLASTVDLNERHSFLPCLTATAADLGGSGSGDCSFPSREDDRPFRAEGGSPHTEPSPTNLINASGREEGHVVEGEGGKGSFMCRGEGFDFSKKKGLAFLTGHREN